MQFFQRISTCPTIPEVIAEATKARATSRPDVLPLDVWRRPSILLALREQGYSDAGPMRVGLQKPLLYGELRAKLRRIP
jgi:hypothetical protein